MAQASQRATRRDSIVEAAARLIRTEGVHAASISDIIAESGTSVGTIYHHFANKNEIVLAVARRTVVEPLQAMLAAHAGEGLSAADLFRAIVDTVISGEVQSALIVQLWAGSSDEPQLKEMMRGQLAGVRVEAVSHLGEWLRARGVPDADERAEALAMLSMGQAMGLLAQRTLVPDLDERRYVAEACRMLDAVAASYVPGQDS